LAQFAVGNILLRNTSRELS